MSSLIDFDDDDFFTKGESLKTPEKNLDEIFGTTNQSGSDNLDGIFGSNTTTTKPLSEKQMEDLFGKDEFEFFTRHDEIKKDEPTKPPAAFDDSFAMLVQSNLDQSGLEKQSHDLSDAKTPDLDFLLEAQPAGMLSSTEDLMMFDPFAEPPRKPKSPVLNPKVKKSSELKIDPSDEFFADAPLSPRLIQQQESSQPPFEIGSKMDDGSQGSNGALKKKRTMERSFEDLLHGLSDDDDLDLDDLVSDNTGYSTNLESILPSPGKSQHSDNTDKEYSTPDKHAETTGSLDLLTSTPNVEITEPVKVKDVKDGEDLYEDFKDIDEEEDEECEMPEVRVVTTEDIVGTLEIDTEVKGHREQDLEEEDFKSWEMVNKEDVGSGTEKTEETLERELTDGMDGDHGNNSSMDGVVRRRRRQPEQQKPEVEINGTQEGVNGRMEKEETIDLSDIEKFQGVPQWKKELIWRKQMKTSYPTIHNDFKMDTNQLDVDINKHKSSVTKRGSLALRRKPSRNSRRSLITEGEDAMFKDSTSEKPRTHSLPNGDSEFLDMGDAELSPPAKKAQPDYLVPLPGLAVKPTQRSSISSPDDDPEVPSEVRRISKPPPGAFKLPAVAPRPSRPRSEVSSKDKVQPSVFEKPALRSVNKTPKSYESVTSESTAVSHVLRSGDDARSHDDRSHDLGRKGSEERDMTFEQPVLKSFPKTRQTDPSGEKDFTFEKPKLRSTPKKSVEIPDNKTETAGSYRKPILRSTPKPSKKADAQIDDSFGLHAKAHHQSALEDASWRRNYGSGAESEQKSFEKHAFRSGHSAVDVDIVANETDLTNPFEKQRHTEVCSDKTESSLSGISKHSPNFESVTHTFEKPVLGKSPTDVQREEKGIFTKPVLRKSPERQLSKDVDGEPKGFYDKPLLKKTENSLNEENMHISTGANKDYSAKFPEMKLRKIEKSNAEERSKSSEKPAWLQAAKNKGPKAMDALQHKENFENHYLGKNEKSAPSWLENSPLRKNPNAVPLQETSQNVGTSENQKGSVPIELSGNQSSLMHERRSSLTQSRTKRAGSCDSTDSDSYRRDRKTGRDNNYSPSWMRQQVSPARSSPSIPTGDTEEIPQWKKELAMRNKKRKDFEALPQWQKELIWRKRRRSTVNSVNETPQKIVTEPSQEPEWMGNIHLRKVRQTPGPVKESPPAEPEWKRAAEEKKARLRSKSLQFSQYKPSIL